MNEVWVTTGSTESGDEWVMVWGHEPTDAEIEAACAAEMPDEWEAECIQGWRTYKESVR